MYRIITFYEFKPLENLPAIKSELTNAMRELGIRGTIIIAPEGYNSTVAGPPDGIERFIRVLENVFATTLCFKSSFHESCPFLKIKIRIKPEIVTLKQSVEIERGAGTHVGSARWNELIADGETIVLDTRNDYEVELGTFRGALNPRIEKFSDLPKFVEENFGSARDKKIAMFCTGGIRCEKFAPFMKGLGFAEVYQLDGGILKYLEETPENDSLWEGECFVFDDRIALDNSLRSENNRKSEPAEANPVEKR
ncbi:MAG: hypothetical protein JSS81_28255 [Acidobacteria bacterium]|nr:hypothetical protein [Acidobacteriota bacterium]